MTQRETAISREKFSGYKVTAALTPGQTFSATDSWGRQVVLKMLDSDCLLRGKLHPSIRDRLGRVRELAHIGVANLYGVERGAGGAFAVWEYVSGQPLDRYVRPLSTPANPARIIAQAIGAIEAMHALGIVHGRIHSGNVLVDELGHVHLTHVSPLLYDDPAADAHDVREMIRGLIAQQGWNDSALAQAVGDGANCSLSEMRAIILQKTESRTVDPDAVGNPVAQPERPPRRRLLIAAAGVSLVGIITAASIAIYAHRTQPQNSTPPQAPPSAMQPPP